MPELYTLPQAEMESEHEEPSPEFGKEVQNILNNVRQNMYLSHAQSPVPENKRTSVEEKPKEEKLKEFQRKVSKILAEIQTKIRELQALEQAFTQVSAKAA